MLLVSATACAAVRVAPHTVFDHTATASLVGKWKPQVVGGMLTSVTGVDRYARARVQLQQHRSQTVLGILDAHSNLYVVTLRDAAAPWNPSGAAADMHPEVAAAVPSPHVSCDSRHFVVAVLWSARDADRTQCFRALWRWHDYHFGQHGAVLLGDALEDDVDRAMWYAANVDADDL